MNLTGSLAAVVALTAFCSSAVDIPCSWTAGETPDSLADGKLQFTYEGEGLSAKVSAIAANPGKGNRIVISGDTMALAENPVITVAEGSIRFDNALDGTGTLVCQPQEDDSTVSWTNATQYLQMAPNWTLIAPGKRLDEYLPTASQGPADAYNPNAMTVYNVVRRVEDGVAYADMQVQFGGGRANSDAGIYLKGVWATLKQTEEGIAAVINKSCYLSKLPERMDGEDLDYLVVHHEYNSADRYPQSLSLGPGGIGYGINQLTLKRIAGFPAVHLAGPVTNSAAGVCLAVSAASGISVRADASSGLGRLPAGAVVSNAGDFVVGGGDATVTEAYGSISSSGTFRYVRDDAVSAKAYYSENYLTNKWPAYFISEGRSLFDITNMTGKINGGYIGKSGKNEPCGMYHYKVAESGLAATGQVQSIAAGSLRCIVVAFRQNGYRLQAVGVRCYAGKTTSTGSADSKLGFDFIKALAEGTTEDYGQNNSKMLNIAQSSDTPAYGIHDFSILFDNPDFDVIRGYSSSLSFSRGGTVEVAGSASGRMMVEFRNTASLPEHGVLEVKNGGDAVLMPSPSIDNLETRPYANDTCLFRVYEGGVLHQRGKWAVGPSQKIELRGGMLNCGYLQDATGADGCVHLNNIYLYDGACITGMPFRIGHTAEYGYWKVRGSSPSHCYAKVVTSSGSKNALCTFVWDVWDVTGDGGADLVLHGAIQRFMSDMAHTNIVMRKTGAGTVRFDRACEQGTEHAARIDLEDGTWLMGASGVAGPDTPFRLMGGTLAAGDGTSHELGPLTVAAAGGGISLGSGATIEFADSSAEAWTVSNKVTVTGFAENAIRFRVGGSGASTYAVPRTRGVFATDGNAPLFVNSSGYLTAVPPGAVLSIR